MKRTGAFEVGQILGHYRIEQRIGQGGIGVVYRATDRRLNRRVALKLFPSHFASDPDTLARLHRGVESAARLQHPSIARVYEFGEEYGQPLIASEWIDGLSVQSLLAKQGALPLERALVQVNQIAEALDYAHEHGVLHGDLKPSNIIVAHKTAAAVLVDFGMAQLGESAAFTTPGAYAGLPEYMSPEQIRGEPLDRRADEYALASVLYEMLAGHPPLVAQTMPALLKQQLHAGAPLISQLKSGIPPHVAAAIAKGLAKNPVDRFPTLGAFSHALTPHTTARPKPRVWMWMGMAGLALVGGVVLWGAISSGKLESSPGFSPIPAKTEPTPKFTPLSKSSNVSNKTRAAATQSTPRWTFSHADSGVGVVVGDDKVIVIRDGGVVKAIDRLSGKEMWNTIVGANVSMPPVLDLIAGEHLVIVPTDAQELWGLNLSNGKVIWRKRKAELHGALPGGATLASDGILYLGSQSGLLQALNPDDGSPYWMWTAYQNLESFEQPLTAADRRFFLASKEGNVIALSATLEEAWRAQTNGAPTTPVLVPPDAATALVGTTQGWIHAYALDSGRERWKQQLDGAITGLVTSSSIIYAATTEGILQAWNISTGEPEWSFDTGSALAAPPVMDGAYVILAQPDGQIRFIRTGDGHEDVSKRIVLQDSFATAPIPAGQWLYARGMHLYGLEK